MRTGRCCIAETASRVTARGLDERLPETGADPEITRLVAMLNLMMDRLEAGFLQDAVELEITNTAPPITADERGAIFERFRRGQAALDGSREGSGLGLSLAHEILAARGGKLMLAEDRGVGMVRFIATLPTPHPTSQDIHSSGPFAQKSLPPESVIRRSI